MSRPPDLDLGLGVLGWFHSWAPDRTIESNRVRYEGMADIEKVGMKLEHDKPDGSGRHAGAIMFDLPGMREVFNDRDMWQVQSWEPLTLTPSVHCNPAKGGCGWHGFITDGKWRNC